MLSLFRKFARSWVAAIIIGLLVISFAVWGLSDVFTGGGAGGVAKVGRETISQAEYRAEFDRLLKRAKAESKRDVTMEEARKEGLDNAVLERMVGDRAFAAYTKSLGLGAAKSVVQNEIAKVQGFQNPSSQRFDQAIYLQALQDNNYTPQMFETSVRNDLARQGLTLAASSGLRAPRVFASQTLAYGTEQRFLTVVPVPAQMAGPPRQPTPAQLTAFYQESREALMRPESRALTLAIGALADFKAKAQIDEAQVRKIFDGNKARLSTPEKRSVVQIVAPDKAKAELAATKLRAGEQPEAIAKQLSLPAPIVLTDVGQTGIPDELVARAAFAAASGEVQAVAAKLQPFAAFKVTAISPAKEADFETHAANIREELRNAAAGELITDASEAFDKVIGEGGTLEAAAAKAGFRLVKIDGVISDGRAVATGQPVPELAEAPGVLRDIFMGAKGDVSDLASLPGDVYMAVRIDGVTPAAPPPLDTIKQELTTEWLRRDIATRLKTQAEAVLAEAKRTSLEAAATKFKLPVLKQPAPLQRGQGGQALSAAVFDAKRGEIVMSQTANGVEFAIIRIEDVVRDDEAVVPERLAQAETAVRASVQRDLAASLDRVARDRAKIKLYPDMMRAALGDTTETQPAGTPAPAKNKTP